MRCARWWRSGPWAGRASEPADERGRRVLIRSAPSKAPRVPGRHRPLRRAARSGDDGIAQEVLEVALAGVLRHGAPDRHHERHGGVDLCSGRCLAGHTLPRRSGLPTTLPSQECGGAAPGPVTAARGGASPPARSARPARRCRSARRRPHPRAGRSPPVERDVVHDRAAGPRFGRGVPGHGVGEAGTSPAACSPKVGRVPPAGRWAGPATGCRPSATRPSARRGRFHPRIERPSAGRLGKARGW